MYLLFEAGDCRRLSQGADRVSTCSELPGLNFIDLVARLDICFGGGVTGRIIGLKAVMVKAEKLWRRLRIRLFVWYRCCFTVNEFWHVVDGAMQNVTVDESHFRVSESLTHLSSDEPVQTRSLALLNFQYINASIRESEKQISSD